MSYKYKHNIHRLYSIKREYRIDCAKQQQRKRKETERERERKEENSYLSKYRSIHIVYLRRIDMEKN